MEKIISIFIAICLTGCYSSKFKKQYLPVFTKPYILKKITIPKDQHIQAYSESILKNKKSITTFEDYLKNLSSKDSFLFIDISNSATHDFLAKNLYLFKKYGYSKVGIFVYNIDDGPINLDSLNINDFSGLLFNPQTFNLYRHFSLSGFDLYNVSSVRLGPIICTEKKIKNDTTFLYYVSADRKYYENTIATPSGVILDTNWDKEKMLAKSIKSAIDHNKGKWLFVFGEQHLYKDRTFSAASYMLNDHGIEVKSIHLNQDKSWERCNALQLDTAVLLLDELGGFQGQHPGRFDVEVCMPQKPNYTENRLTHLPIGFKYASKELENTGKRACLYVSVFRDEYKRLGTEALPFDAIYLRPRQFYIPIEPENGRKYKTYKIQLSND